MNSVKDGGEHEVNEIDITTKSSASTPSLIKKEPEVKSSGNSIIDLIETLPGLEHLSGEQLFFLNFAQVSKFVFRRHELYNPISEFKLRWS